MPSRAVPLPAAVVLAAALMPSGAACARPLDDVVAGGALRIGVYRDNPPFSFST